MHTLGHTFIPPGIHPGGLRYHGMAPSVSALVEHGDVEARAVKQLTTFEAAVQFSKAEGTHAPASWAGVIPAPESAHAIRATIDEALKCKERGEKKVIAFNLSGHGHFDTPALAKRFRPFGSVMAYEAYHHGQLEDYEYPQAAVEEAMTRLPEIAL